ncbi:MAG TPA: hypothetical protein VK599_13445 [Streptosporangiaceae bacterium]|nr:hypothetical protein [Streptosporangiaceae bacterium]
MAERGRAPEADGVKARIWKDRLAGEWCFYVPPVSAGWPALLHAGRCPAWDEALSETLAVLAAGTVAQA